MAGDAQLLIGFLEQACLFAKGNPECEAWFEGNSLPAEFAPDIPSRNAMSNAAEQGEYDI